MFRMLFGINIKRRSRFKLFNLIHKKMKKLLFLVVLAAMITACDKIEKTPFNEDNTLTLLTNQTTGLKGLAVGLEAVEKSGKKILPVEYDDIQLIYTGGCSSVFTITKDGQKTLCYYNTCESEPVTKAITVPQDKMITRHYGEFFVEHITIAEKDGKFYVYEGSDAPFEPFDNLFWHPDHKQIIVERDGVYGIMTPTEDGLSLDLRYEEVYLLHQEGYPDEPAQTSLVRKKGDSRFAEVSLSVLGFVPAKDMAKILSVSKITDKYVLTVPKTMVSDATFRYSRNKSFKQAAEDIKY